MSMCLLKCVNLHVSKVHVLTKFCHMMIKLLVELNWNLVELNHNNYNSTQSYHKVICLTSTGGVVVVWCYAYCDVVI